jgi:hypothetical protein
MATKIQLGLTRCVTGMCRFHCHFSILGAISLKLLSEEGISGRKLSKEVRKQERVHNSFLFALQRGHQERRKTALFSGAYYGQSQPWIE